MKGFSHNPWSVFFAAAALCLCGMPIRTGAKEKGPSLVYYVSVNGNDQWTGKRAAPDSTQTDGPFASLAQAMKAIRADRASAVGTNSRPAVIHLGPGTYPLNEPLVLQPQDSGLSIIGPEKQKAVLSGGRKINGWKIAQRDGKQFFETELPDVRSGTWFFRELWVGGKRAVRARHPNQGYLKVAGLSTPQPEWTKGQTEFLYSSGDLPESATLTGAEVVVMNRWVDSRLPVLNLQPDAHTIRFSKRSVFALEKGDPYYLEGTFDALDEPGEWYLDQRTGVLDYMPRSTDSLKNLQVFAPKLAQVLRFEGQPQEHRFVERVTLRNLTFSHTEWCFPEGFSKGANAPEISPAPEPQVGGFGQAEVGVPGAVWGQGVKDCLIEECQFAHLGDYALELTRGCQDNRIVGCDFSDLGAGGIKLGETGIHTEDSLLTRGNEVTDCRIHDGGKMFHSAIGVWIGQSPGNRILHDEIYNFFYTGISIGWTWGYGPSLASNNLVAFNHIHHIGIKTDGDGPILSDMGGIYTLGKQPGTRIENNLWHDIAGLRYGGWGIYFDEGSSGIVAVSNVVYRTTHGGFHQHYGETNILRNNIFAFARDHQLQRTRVEPHISFLFQTNIVYFNHGVLLGGDWSKDQYKLDWNVYYDARPDKSDLLFEKATLDQWRGRGHDAHSLVVDPLFEEPEKNNFRLRAQSPALALGFEPIDTSRMGPRPDRKLRSVPE
jgi:hypothetical protein